MQPNTDLQSRFCSCESDIDSEVGPEVSGAPSIARVSCNLTQSDAGSNPTKFNVKSFGVAWGEGNHRSCVQMGTEVVTQLTIIS